MMSNGSIKTNCSGAVWVIGLNAMEEYRFIHKLSSNLYPTTRLIFAPSDLHDGVNRWKWIGDVNRGVDVVSLFSCFTYFYNKHFVNKNIKIILLLRESSLSIYAAGKSSDPFETLFIEQMTSLHPSDHRIVSFLFNFQSVTRIFFPKWSVLSQKKSVHRHLFRYPSHSTIVHQISSIHRQFSIVNLVISLISLNVYPIADSPSPNP